MILHCLSYTAGLLLVDGLYPYCDKAVHASTRRGGRAKAARDTGSQSLGDAATSNRS